MASWQRLTWTETLQEKASESLEAAPASGGAVEAVKDRTGSQCDQNMLHLQKQSKT